MEDHSNVHQRMFLLIAITHNSTYRIDMFKKELREKKNEKRNY